jgi:hypothetical protein
VYGQTVSNTGPQWVSWAQGCLRSVIGSWVPQSGVLSKATRRAIRMFQKRQRIPITGILDGATEAALRAACDGGQAAAPAPARAPRSAPPASEPVDAGDPEPEPEPAAAADSGPAEDEPPDEGDSEVLFGDPPSELEQEFQVSGNCQVTITRHGPVPLTPSLKAAKAPGVYTIHIDNKAWYVGVTERTIHQRFQDRMKTMRDFNLPDSLLANRTVSWVAIQSGQYPVCSIGRRESTKPTDPYKPLTGVLAVLKILEQYQIQVDKPAGNKRTECVRFGPRGSLTINEAGKDPIVLNARSKIFQLAKCKKKK